MKYDIVLLSPPSRAINHYRLPLSLMYVAEWYRNQRQSVKIIDPKIKEVIRDKQFFRNRNNIIEEVKDDILNQLNSVNSDNIGITCYSTEFEEVKTLIRDIRNWDKRKITVGGIHPTLKPEDFKGIADEIIQGRRDIGQAAYDLVDMDYYSNANPYAIRGVFLRSVYILSSIGCPSQCNFCCAKSLRKYFGVATLKTPEQLIEEILTLKEKYALDSFYFIDDLFTLHNSNVIRFCELISGSHLLWGCSSKVTTLDERTIKKMAKAGCIQLDFGVERGSNEALNRLKKGQTVEKIKEVFKWCKKYHIRTFANFIINIPGEVTKDRKDIKNLVQEIWPTITSINIFRGYLGTELPDQIPNNRLVKWAEMLNKKFNSIWRNLFFHFSFSYLRCWLRSKNKTNYLKQLNLLIKEAINQKWT